MTAETQADQRTNTALTDRLRGEIAASQDRGLHALLLHEVGVLHEAGGEEPLAARDYLAAYNADADFREPLESLVRILSRRRSFKNLAKLLDTMAKNAPTPEERARALRELAVVALEHDKNKEDARARLEEAVTEFPDEMAAWLELELLAAEAGDVAGVMRAIEARLPLVGDATYKALLYIQLAELAAKVGQTSRAYEHLDAAAALEGRARFQTRLVLERVAQQAADLDVLARALEGQADLVVEVLDDPSRGEEIGVPNFMRTAAFAADAWLRAAEIRKRLGDVEAANALLHEASRRVPNSNVVARARLGALELQGDLERAAELARSELNAGAMGRNAASLWLRIAESAALANDRAQALDALRNALTADPEAIPARAIELDLLVDGQEPQALAGAIEGCASSFRTKSAQSRGFVLAAYVWAVLAGESNTAQAALSRAVSLGLSPTTSRRLARSLAAVAGDNGWYEAATEELLGLELEPAHKADLWFELGRIRLLAGNNAGAHEAFTALALLEGVGPLARSAWLGRMLAGCAVGLGSSRTGGEPELRSPTAMDALAASESNPGLARGLAVVAALRAALGGEPAGAVERLRLLQQADPSDELVAVFLSELLRGSDGSSAAEAALPLATCADACSDSSLANSLRIEAAFLLWSGGDRNGAVAQLEVAAAADSNAAVRLLSWARRGSVASGLEARRALLEAEAGSLSGADVYAAQLERFALEVLGGGDEGAAITALESAEQAPAEGTSRDLALAAALGRLLYGPATANRDQALAAVDLLESEGGEASLLARAERLRIARDVDQDVEAALACARHWSEAEPAVHTALELLVAADHSADRETEIEARQLLASSLTGAAGEAMAASAVIVSMLDRPASPLPLLKASHASGRLANLELAPPGCDPRRRAVALHGLDEVMGAEAYVDALLLAGYSDLAAGEPNSAFETFKVVVEARPEDLAGWEGVRAAAEILDNPVETAMACAQLGQLCLDDARGARYWEHAGLLLLDRTEHHDDAEIALDRAFARDARCGKAFDKLFRRVRARKEDDRLLALIERRVEVANDNAELVKLFWERARVLQKRGNNDAALEALEHVTMLEPDHVGALALSGTICIQKGDFAGAAPLMARLSQSPEAPKQERLVSGITACDLYENKLNQPERALAVLVQLHKEGLSTLPVRERLARAAARTGSWSEATSMLETLMNERDTASGRVDAARLAMAIWRDKVQKPESALQAVTRLIEEVPDDPEALELILGTAFSESFRAAALTRGKQRMVESLQRDPCDRARVQLLARIAAAQGDLPLRQATLGVLVALGKTERAITEELTQLDAKILSRPQSVLDARSLAEIADPADSGPVQGLFSVAAETALLALGPSTESLQVGRKNRVDAKGGPPLRLEVAQWLGALGFDQDFELYVGGREAAGVTGVISGDLPGLVIGAEVQSPLDPASRSAVAREVFALRRGITCVRHHDDSSVAAVAIAVCNELGVPIPNPGYPLYGEISRAVHKGISKRVKKAAPPFALDIQRVGQDPRAWVGAAVRSCDRMAALAAGDVSIVLANMLGRPRTELEDAVKDNDRAKTLLKFVLSPGYLELRRKLGMGVR
jgi:tetratricopeptide (TPR) repeat protein